MPSTRWPTSSPPTTRCRRRWPTLPSSIGWRRESAPPTPEAKAQLRKRFETEAARVHYYRTVTLATPVPFGPGRIDAFNLITTRMLATETGIAENWSSPRAPVKPPFVWNAPQGSWTQWSGTVQDPIAPQPRRDPGRVRVDGLPLQDPCGRPLRHQRATRQPGEDRAPARSSRAAEVAGRGVRQDRPRQGRGGQGPVRDALRELPQRVSLHLDGAEQVRQALHPGGTRSAGVRGHRSGAVQRHRGIFPRRATWPSSSRRPTRARRSCPRRSCGGS